MRNYQLIALNMTMTLFRKKNDILRWIFIWSWCSRLQHPFVLSYIFVKDLFLKNLFDLFDQNLLEVPWFLGTRYFFTKRRTKDEEDAFAFLFPAFHKREKFQQQKFFLDTFSLCKEGFFYLFICIFLRNIFRILLNNSVLCGTFLWHLENHYD